MDQVDDLEQGWSGVRHDIIAVTDIVKSLLPSLAVANIQLIKVTTS